MHLSVEKLSLYSIGSWSNWQISRTAINSWMSLNFRQIGLLTGVISLSVSTKSVFDRVL